MAYLLHHIAFPMERELLLTLHALIVYLKDTIKQVMMTQHIEKKKSHPAIDKSLIRMFLKMTPEDRLISNDNSIRTIFELRNAIKNRKDKSIRSKYTS
ncbi:MAG: hypothetical protein MUP22_02160 [Desulfobacterales bacterium]|nr:hypothetical protein [Desulfobacterales bacterium]